LAEAPELGRLRGEDRDGGAAGGERADAGRDLLELGPRRALDGSRLEGDAALEREGGDLEAAGAGGALGPGGGAEVGAARTEAAGELDGHALDAGGLDDGERRLGRQVVEDGARERVGAPEERARAGEDELDRVEVADRALALGVDLADRV